MKKLILFVMLLGFATVGTAAPVKPGKYYVTTDRLNVRLAPATSGRVTNKLDRRQKVDVFEVEGDWARISKYYNGCIESRNPSMCVEADVPRVARWVSAKYLSKTRPPEEVIKASSTLENAIKQSDDYTKYRAGFNKVTQQLLDSRRCTLAELKDMGGWVRSTDFKNTYFSYCGGLHRNNRIYINPVTAKVIR